MKIVMYHYVRPLSNSFIKGLKGLEIKDFVIQLDYLSKKYKIIDPNEFYFSIRNNIKLDDNSILLTFDDGYSDVYKYVFPELYKRKLKGLFYVPDFFKKKKPLDVNLIHILLTRDDLISEYILYIKSFLKKNTYLRSFESYLSEIKFQSRYDTKEVELLKCFLQYLLPNEVRSNIIEELFHKYIDLDLGTVYNELYISKDQLNIMIDAGMHIGGHSVSHRWLSELTYDEQEDEIIGTKFFLDQLKDQDYHSFSYPSGMYNASTIKLLIKHGFKFAFTTVCQNYDNLNDSIYEIPRFDTNDFYPKKLLY